MALTVKDAVCGSSGKANEDAWGSAHRAAWVLDGATGVAPSPHIDPVSDAAWFAREMSNRFDAIFASGLPTIEAVYQTLAGVCAAAGALCRLDAVPAFELPSAALVIARETDAGLEFTNLGDSIVLWRRYGSAAVRFGSCAELNRLEEALHRMLDAGVAEGLERTQAVQRAFAQARENRKLMNQPGGYPILDLSGQGLAGAQVEVREFDGPMDVLLMSDGFSRLVEVYGVYDRDSLMDAAIERGLLPLYQELRAIEAADEHCLRHQRLKARDDATAVRLSWT